MFGGVGDPTALKAHTISHHEPFDPVHQRTEATATGPDGSSFAVSKAAPQVILAHRRDGRITRPRRAAAARPTAHATGTIATALQMGVSLKMVTGDAIAIAKETAVKVGLGSNILDATGLGDVKKKESEPVAESIETADGFAQAFPSTSTTTSTSSNSAATPSA